MWLPREIVFMGCMLCVCYVSGGIERSWEGVPRKFFDAESQQTRCVCVRTTGAPSDPSLPDVGRGDLEHPSLKEYDDCSPQSNICDLH